jgi:hypothetical protein
LVRGVLDIVVTDDDGRSCVGVAENDLNLGRDAEAEFSNNLSLANAADLATKPRREWSRAIYGSIDDVCGLRDSICTASKKKT